MMAHPIATRTTAARCLAMPVCDAFSIAKTTTGRKRHLPQLHRAEAAGSYGTSVPTDRNAAVGGRHWPQRRLRHSHGELMAYAPSTAPFQSSGRGNIDESGARRFEGTMNIEQNEATV